LFPVFFAQRSASPLYRAESRGRPVNLDLSFSLLPFFLISSFESSRPDFSVRLLPSCGVRDTKSFWTFFGLFNHCSYSISPRRARSYAKAFPVPLELFSPLSDLSLATLLDRDRKYPRLSSSSFPDRRFEYRFLFARRASCSLSVCCFLHFFDDSVFSLPSQTQYSTGFPFPHFSAGKFVEEGLRSGRFFFLGG